MIDATQLHKLFGAFNAVRDISLNVAEGEVVALLGPNGAGKTTTVRMLGAILKPTSGTRAHRRLRRGRAGAPGAPRRRAADRVPRLIPSHALDRVPGILRSTPGHAPGRNASGVARLLLQQFGLWEARDKRLDSYSKGMKQKIALIRALIHDPPVLFLDEPTTAMDPHSARTVRDAIAELRAARRTILLTTHNLVEAETLADRIVVVRGGTDRRRRHAAHS